MTSHTPINAQELEQIKCGLTALQARFRAWGADLSNEAASQIFQQLSQDAMSAYLVTMPRCLAEIERLRAALQEIYDDGVPYAYGKAAKALGITPPPMP